MEPTLSETIAAIYAGYANVQRLFEATEDSHGKEVASLVHSEAWNVAVSKWKDEFMALPAGPARSKAFVEVLWQEVAASWDDTLQRVSEGRGCPRVRSLVRISRELGCGTGTVARVAARSPQGAP